MLYYRTDYYRCRKNHRYAGRRFLPFLSLHTAHRLLICILKHILRNVSFSYLLNLLLSGKRFPIQLSGSYLLMLQMRNNLRFGSLRIFDRRCLTRCRDLLRFRWLITCTLPASVLYNTKNCRCHRSRNRSDYNKNDVFILFFLIPCDAASFLLHN